MHIASHDQTGRYLGPMGSEQHYTRTAAQVFGEYVTHRAMKAGYDLTVGGTGRKELAERSGMSLSAVRRMLLGETLPMPHAYEPLARALDMSVRSLLIKGGVISASSWPDGANGAVASHPVPPPSPGDVADAWGLTDPVIRAMFLANAQQARELQESIDTRTGGGAAARG